MSGPGVIAAEPVDRCELCGTIAEARPYGPNGEEVCFGCGMKDEDAAKRRFCQHVGGRGLPRRRVRRKTLKIAGL